MKPAAGIDPQVAIGFGAAVLVAMALPSAAGLVLDTRELRGVSVWDKPLKFQFSLALHLLTLAVAVRLLGAGKARREVRLSVLAVVLCALLEALYIVLQAARGRESHFNRETSWESAAYYAGMGTGAIVILLGTAVVGWRLWRTARDPRTSGLHDGMAWGLLAGSAATLVAVVPLSSGVVDGLGHWVGGVRWDANGLALAGWSTTGGDLRVPHFFATHMMQAVPFAGWMADRFDRGRRRLWVHGTVVLGILLVALTLVQAITGRPLIAS